jgi:hypothetical protein
MPTQVDWPKPAAVVCATASYVNVPDRDTMPAYTHARNSNTYVDIIAQITGGAWEGLTDFAGPVNVAGHDANLARARLDDARAVRPDQAGLRLRHQRMFYLQHHKAMSIQ